MQALNLESIEFIACLMGEIAVPSNKIDVYPIS